MSRATDLHNLRQMAEHLHRVVFYLRQLTEQTEEVIALIDGISSCRQRVLQMVEEMKKVKND